MKIDSSKISVVIQGAVEKVLTLDCIRSIKAHLPESEIILSTWEGTDITPFEGLVKILLSKDPGGKPISTGGALNNTNRQIISSLRGIEAATRPYTLKFRTDCRLEGTGFIDIFSRYPERAEKLRLFQKKLVVPRYASRIETAKRPYLFHPADIAIFGLTKDLRVFFDVPLVSDGEFDWVGTLSDQSAKDLLSERNLLSRYVPEQHIFLNALNKSGFNIDLPHAAASTSELVSISQLALINNFIVVPESIFGLKHLKDRLEFQAQTDSITCYSPSQYGYMYKLLIDPSFRISLKDRLYGASALDFKSIEGLIKHGRRTRAYAKLSGTYTHKFLAELLVTIFWVFGCAAKLTALAIAPRKKQETINQSF